MEIITNDDITPFLKAFDKSRMNCVSFKEAAYRGMNEVISKKFAAFHEHYKKGSAFNDRKNFQQAQLAFIEAQKHIGDLSVYIEEYLKKDLRPLINKEPSDSINRNYQFELELAMNKIAAEFSKEFSEYDVYGELSNTFVKDKINKGNIVRFEIRDSVELRNWFKEVNFRFGEYESVYQEQLIKRLSRALNFALDNFGDYIRTLKFDYIGTADAAGFKRKKAPLRLQNHPEIGKDYNRTNKTIKEKELPFSEPDRVRIENFKFQELANLRAKADYYEFNKKGQRIEVRKAIDSDYSKNLALAYLRARYRHDKLISKLPNLPNKKYLVSREERGEDICDCNCNCNITVLVKNEVGYEHRSVNMNIVIEFYSSYFDMEEARSKKN